MNSAHGGKRPGAGRKPTLGRKAMTRRIIYLTDEMIAVLEKIGNGSLAEGIRKLAAKLIPKKRK